MYSASLTAPTPMVVSQTKLPPNFFRPIRRNFIGWVPATTKSIRLRRRWGNHVANGLVLGQVPPDLACHEAALLMAPIGTIVPSLIGRRYKKSERRPTGLTS